MFITTSADKAGRSAPANLAELYESCKIRVIIAEPPEGRKDWNDALVELSPEWTQRAVEQAPATSLAQEERPDEGERKPLADALLPASDRA